MLRDLALVGWPVRVLTAGAIALEYALRPRASNPRPSVALAGGLPAVTFLALACAYVAYVPHWQGE
jgi:hypothetical protein